MDDVVQFLSNPANVLFLSISFAVFAALGIIAMLFFTISANRQSRMATYPLPASRRKPVGANPVAAAVDSPKGHEIVKEIVGPMMKYRDMNSDSIVLPSTDVIGMIRQSTASLYRYLIKRAFTFHGRPIPEKQTAIDDGITMAMSMDEREVLAATFQTMVEYECEFEKNERLIIFIEVCGDCMVKNPMTNGRNAVAFAKGIALNLLCQAHAHEVSALIRISTHNDTQVVQYVRPESFDKAVEMTLWSKLYDKTDFTAAVKIALHDAYSKHSKYTRTHVVMITDHSGINTTLSKDDIERYKESRIYLHCIVLGEDIQKIQQLAHTYKMYPKLRRDEH